MSGWWTSVEFYAESIALTRATNLCADADAVPSKGDDDDLVLQWNLETIDDNYECLLRSATIWKPSKDRDNKLSEDEVGVPHFDTADLEEDTEVCSGCTDDDSSKVLLAWNFSIVFSHTWRCPVLYFTISLESGQILNRAQVLAELPTPCQTPSVEGNNDDDDTSWDFCSYDEHPVDGQPACFLHPCQTVNRLSSVMESDDDAHAFATGEKLLSWMSLMLPSVGFPIASPTYRGLQQKLKDSSEGRKIKEDRWS